MIDVFWRDSDLKAVEFGFWSNQIFLQSDTPLFTHTAESANFNTTAAGPVAALSAGAAT